jgi:glucose-1-phosphate adenylyltransferase
MFQSGSIDVLTPEENEKEEKVWFEGTADAVRKTLSTTLKSKADYFLILSGDQLYHIDFSAMGAFAEESGADITIAAKPVPQCDAERFGILQIDEKNILRDLVEKPKQGTDLRNFSYRGGSEVLASMGIYLFKREVLRELLESNPGIDFGRDLLGFALRKWKTAAYLYDGYWEDIGTVRSYYEANLLLTANGCGVNLYDEAKPIYTKQTFLPGPQIKAALVRDSILCDGSRIDAAEIEHSVIGMRTHIEKGTVLRNSLLLGSCLIGKNCQIEGAIIDENVRMGNNVCLINKSGRDHFDGDGVFIRDSILIVTAGTTLQDHFTL